jgi:flagellar basal-body rod modification protein FlgD
MITPATTAADSKTAVDYQSFLKLLTAQLRNQDPLAPMDATQFITQLAQFSTVEQAMQTNQTLTQLLETLKASSTRFDMAYLGRTVDASTDVAGLVDGELKVAYAVDPAATEVRIDILDLDGKVVRSLPGETGSGRHEVRWDGSLAGGGSAPDGSYRIRIVAKNAAGDPLDAATVVTERIREIRQVDGTSLFVLDGGATVRAEDILGIRA